MTHNEPRFQGHANVRSTLLLLTVDNHTYRPTYRPRTELVRTYTCPTHRCNFKLIRLTGVTYRPTVMAATFVWFTRHDYRLD